MTADGSKYGKYIVTEMKPNVVETPYTPPVPIAANGKEGRVLWLDSEVIPGAFYVETVWEYPQPGDEPRETQAHTHDYDEVLGFFGTDIDRPHDLCGEVEFWLGDEKHVLTRSCLIFVPKGLSHAPFIVRRADKPIFAFSTFAGQMYK